VDGRAAHCLDDSGRQVREIARNAERARSGAHVGPGQLAEACPFIVDEVRDLVPGAGLENDRLDALEREFGAQRAPPAPEPTMATTVSPLRSNCPALSKSSLSELVDVVEAAGEIAAMDGGSDC